MNEFKFRVDGRDLSTYQLSNEEVVNILKGNGIVPEEREHLMNEALRRFERDCCPKAGENENDVFFRHFSNWANGGMRSEQFFDGERPEWLSGQQAVARKMSRDHRYLQSEMFKLCLEYVKCLAKAYDNGCYDPRNEWACTAAHHMLNGIKEADYPY